MLLRLHEGHQGIIKTQRRAKMSLWWPDINVHIKNLIARCSVCIQHQVNRAEPMIATPLPLFSWQKVGADLYHFGGKTFLIIVDYFSRFIERAFLSSTNAACVIKNMSSIFARHGVPEEIISDGGQPFPFKEFCKFACDYGFDHAKSSPYYSQSNGEAERAVQTIKNILKKAVTRCHDPYLGILAYRTTPLEGGYSPSQLLMGRQLRSPLPLLPQELEHSWLPLEHFREGEMVRKAKMKKNYDRRRGVRELNPLLPGEKGFIKKSGEVTNEKSLGNRSYLCNKSDGSKVWRN